MAAPKIDAQALTAGTSECDLIIRVFANVLGKNLDMAMPDFGWP